jgi:hypothetical protein
LLIKNDQRAQLGAFGGTNVERTPAEKYYNAKKKRVEAGIIENQKPCLVFALFKFVDEYMQPAPSSISN